MIRDYNQAANDLRVLISLLEKQQQENQAGKSSKTNIADDLNRASHRLLSAEESAQKRIPLNQYLILYALDMQLFSFVLLSYLLSTIIQLQYFNER